MERTSILKAVEVFFTANEDFVGETIATWISEVAWDKSGLTAESSLEEVLKVLPEWFMPVLGVEDLPGAYRIIPLHEEDIKAAIIAVWSEAHQDWRL